MLRGTREGLLVRRLIAVATFATMTIVFASTADFARAKGDGMNALSARAMQAVAAFKVPTIAKKKAPSVAKKKAPKQAKATKLATKSKTKNVATKSAQKKSTKKRVAKVASKAKVKGKAKAKGTAKLASASAFIAKAPIRKSIAKKGGGTSKGNVSWNAPSGCVPARLKGVLHQVSQKFGPVVVNSSVRSRKHNRRVGGARASWHLKCMAVDFRVHGSHKGLWAFLRQHPSVGGLKRYALGFFHIDMGPKRSW